MMRKILLSLTAVLMFWCASAQVSRRTDPSVAAVGKEPARGDVVSHGSRAEAIRGEYHTSQYLQPLGDWTRSETAEAVTYKTRYKIPFAWIDRQMFLHLGRVSSSFDVVVNGRPAGYSQTGSTPSEFDVTAVSQEGNNDLEIIVYRDPVARRLENNRQPDEPRIAGETYILSQPKMRVRDVFLNNRVEGENGLLEFGVIMKSHQLNVKDYKVYYELLSPRGEVLSEGYKDAVLDMRREDTVRFFANIRGIVPWSHEEPKLYTLLVKTQHEGRFREYLSFRIGFRGIEERGGMVYLNGTPLRIVMHEFIPTEDRAGTRARVEGLIDQGYNTLKLKGVPSGHWFYAMCDEMGVYVCNQADIDTHQSGLSREVGGNPSNAPEWEGAYLDRVMSMYHSSKNSPSVIMFSLADQSANGYNLYESYLAMKAVEHHRPVIYTDGGEWNSDRLDTAAMEAIESPAGEEWATVTADDVDKGLFRVHNTRRFTPVYGEAAYKIAVGKKVVSRGSVPLRIQPGSEAGIAIPINNVKEGKRFTVQIEVKTERPVNKYVLSAESDGKKIFRETAIDEKDKIVVTRRSFESARPFAN